MIISKQNRRIIYENLFKGGWIRPSRRGIGADHGFTEGVLVAKKDYNAPKHEELDVPNLEVIKAMQSLTSKSLVKTQFSWQWYYYVLTPEGVEYLREWFAPSTRFQCDVLILVEGYTSLPKLSLPPTKRQLVHLAPLVFVPEEKVLTVHPVAIGKTTAKRRGLLRGTEHNMLELVGVLPGSKILGMVLLCHLPSLQSCSMHVFPKHHAPSISSCCPGPIIGPLNFHITLTPNYPYPRPRSFQPQFTLSS